MKKIIMLLVAFFCSLALFSTGFAEPIVCKIADPTPKTFSYYQALLTFEKEVEAATGGKVDVQIFGDGVLGRHQTTTESTMMGSIQGTVVTSAWTQNLVKEHIGPGSTVRRETVSVTCWRQKDSNSWDTPIPAGSGL
jgi:TRAP-type C4-dicarboxylate transport system substrate-binding protein